jgi:23S rRNA (uracil1939-C5)-methyltransferase
MGRKKKNIVLDQLEVVDFTVEGKALAKHNGLVVFIKGAVPGDIVDVQVTKKRKSFMEGHVKHYHKYSDMRIDAFCSHFEVCGGCKWQHIPYEKQLEFKAKQVSEALERIGKVRPEEYLPIIPSEETKHYRNKLSYTFSDLRWLSSEEIASGDEIDRRALGFHVPGRFDKILHVEKCYLQPDYTNEIRNKVYDFVFNEGLSFYNHHKLDGFLRDLVVRNNGNNEWMVTVVFNADIQDDIQKVLNFIRDSFPQVKSLHYIINPKMNDSLTDLPSVHYSGEPHLIEQLENVKYKVSPQSFFQTNTKQALKLYEVTRDFAGLSGSELVYDLYTGTGSIALFVAKQAAKVIGVEYVQEAIDDAQVNAELNGIKNTEFFAGDLKDVLTDGFVDEHGVPDVLITDPPRSGMHADVVNTILRVEPKRIVYVSCNPSTQARDISMLSEKYSLKKIQAVDMFPHTSHIESVALLEKK